MNPILFSKDKNDWETPDDLFQTLNEVFDFSLDCAASPHNTKCLYARTSASSKEWTAEGETALWLNPPYSPSKLCKELCSDTILKAKTENIPAVLLIPARTDTVLWQKTIFKECKYVFFFSGRIKFVGGQHTATFPSALCITDMNETQLELFTQRFGKLGKLVSL